MTRYIQNGCETHLKRGKNPPSLKLRCDALPSFNAASSANAAALVAVTFVPGESGYMGDTPADELGEMWGAYDCGLASSYFILAAKNHGWNTLIMGIRDTAK